MPLRRSPGISGHIGVAVDSGRAQPKAAPDAPSIATDPPMTGISRRRFIHLVGRAGGIAAAYRTAAAMGILPLPAAYAGPPDLPAGSGAGIRALVIGAGIAGMVAALELGKAGYAVRVLEARARPG